VHSRNIIRIIDANLNRVQEGLRVCEDTTRFMLDDNLSTRSLKAIRHKIHRAIASAKLTKSLLCESRNTKADVGTDFSWLEEREDWQSVFYANLQRVKESLRVLEEFFKLFDNKTGEKFKILRFEVYEFEKKVVKRSKALSDSKSYPQPRSINC